MPDVWLDETAEGNVFAALRLREADLDKHLQGKDEKKDEARTKARDEARKKFEEQVAKSKDQQPKPLPEFGSAEDWPLRQALNQLQGKTVVASKTRSSARRKPRPSRLVRVREQGPLRGPCFLLATSGLVSFWRSTLP